MHTEPKIRRVIKPIIEKYGQLNTTELKSILATQNKTIFTNLLEVRNDSRQRKSY